MFHKIKIKWNGGVAFYCFPEISHVEAFKIDYRKLLDNLTSKEEEKLKIVEEGKVAFQKAIELLDGLPY